MQAVYEQVEKGEFIYGFFSESMGRVRRTDMMSDNKNPLILTQWLYWMNHPPEFNIGHTLRQLEIANSTFEEFDLSLEWQLSIIESASDSRSSITSLLNIKPLKTLI